MTFIISKKQIEIMDKHALEEFIKRVFENSRKHLNDILADYDDFELIYKIEGLVDQAKSYSFEYEKEIEMFIYMALQNEFILEANESSGVNKILRNKNYDPDEKLRRAEEILNKGDE